MTLASAVFAPGGWNDDEELPVLHPSCLTGFLHSARSDVGSKGFQAVVIAHSLVGAPCLGLRKHQLGLQTLVRSPQAHY